METTGTQSNRKTITGLQCTVTDSFNSFPSSRVRSRRFVILLVRFRGLESVGNRHELGRSTNLRCIHYGTYTYEVHRHKFTNNQHANMQCSGSEAGSVGSVWYFASWIWIRNLFVRIRILPSTSKKMKKKTLVSTVLWLLYGFLSLKV